MKRNYPLWIGLGLLAAAGISFAGKSLSSAAIEITHPTRGPAVEAVYATGTVEATVMLPISPRTGARLMELNADEGQRVTKDQVLARMEDTDLRNSLAELQARESFAHDDYLRKATLAQRGVTPRATADQAKADWDAAKAAVQRATAEAGYMQLLSPADGMIIRRDGEIGQLIPANQPVFWLSCCAPLRISAEVDEEDIAQVQPNQKVLIRADAFPGKVFNGEVQAITPKGDPVARSYRVRIGFTQDVPLQIGMTAETNIVISEKEDALLVPSGSISQNKLWLVKDGRLHQQEVETGAKGAAETEIKSGLTQEDSVVLHPQPDFKEGKKVRSKLTPS